MLADARRRSSRSPPSVGAPAGRLLRRGQPDDDAVVRPDGLDLDPQALPEARLDGQAHGAWTRAPNGRQEHDPPVAQLVAEALHHDGPVRRQRARDLPLLVEVGEQVARGQRRRGRGARRRVRQRLLATRRAAIGLLPDAPREGAQLAAQLDGPPDLVALPERHLAGLARRRGHRAPGRGRSTRCARPTRPAG